MQIYAINNKQLLSQRHGNKTVRINPPPRSSNRRKPPLIDTPERIIILAQLRPRVLRARRPWSPIF